MTITVTRQTKDYDRAKVTGQFVRYDPTDGTYRWCQQATIGRGSKKRTVDVAVGMCSDSDLPTNVAAAARAACVNATPYVDWPL